MNTDNKMDRRIKKTRSALNNSLINLLAQKSINSISVKELCDFADVNRSTFYLHYNDIYDLLEAMENDLFEDIERCFHLHPNAAEIKENPLPFIADILNSLKEHKDLVKVLLGPHEDTQFKNRLKQLILPHIHSNWNSLFANPNKLNYEYFSAFIIDGYMGMIQHWLKQDCAQSPKEIAQIMQNIVLIGIHVLES